MTETEIPINGLEKKTKLIVGDDRIVYHVGKELPETGTDFLMVSGRAHAQGYGIYCGDRPDIRYGGGETYRQKVDRTPIYCMPLHGIWRTGTSKMNYPTFNTEGRAVLMQDIRYFDVDLPASNLTGKAYMREKTKPNDIQNLRFYYSFNPVYFDEPTKFWQGNFAEEYREGKVAFEDIIFDLMRENGKYEDRMDEQIVRTQLEEAVHQGIIPAQPEFLNDLRSTPLEGKIWIGSQEKDKERNYTELIQKKKWAVTVV